MRALLGDAPDGTTEGARAVRRSLRRVARLAGKARDPDVHGEVLAAARAELSSRPTSPWPGRWAATLARESRVRRRALGRAMREEWERDLAAGLRSASVLLDGGARSAPPLPSWRRSAQRHSRRLLDAFERARRRPSTKRLHRLRQSIREARLFDALAEGRRVPVARAAPPAVRQLQARLGRLHDLEEFRSKVEASGPLPRGDPVWALLERRRRGLRRRLEREVRTTELEEALRRWRGPFPRPARRRAGPTGATRRHRA